ncbi:MAG: hypothetical protein IM583_01050, partial [Pseudanabaena sp. M114S2SP2A07QC]|nr:hypothetical protein [Pseudanabaena sp. M114S2SP2A07QC]
MLNSDTSNPFLTSSINPLITQFDSQIKIGNGLTLSVPSLPQSISPFDTQTHQPANVLDLTQLGQSVTSLAFLGTSGADKLYFTFSSKYNSLGFSTDGATFTDVKGLQLSRQTVININLGGGDDQVFLDSSFVKALNNSGAKVKFDGGDGNDILLGSNVDTIWNVTGENSGNTGNVEFLNVENLKGAANNNDTFIFSATGNLSGTVDGNIGGFDTLEIDGGKYAKANYVATSPDAGTITLDSKLITYAGLEPIIDRTVVSNRIFTATASADNIVLAKYNDGTNIISSSNNTFESVVFLNPSGSLTINAGSGDDTITINSVDNSFLGSLIINGENGRDSVSFAQNLSLNGGSLTATVETITVNSNIVISTRNLDASSNSDGNSGNVTFTGENITLSSGAKIYADKTGTGAFTSGNVTLKAEDITKRTGVEPFGYKKKSVSVTLANGSVITGADITIASTAEDKTSLSDLPAYAQVLLKPFTQLPSQFFNALLPASVQVRGGDATITLNNAQIQSSGKVNIASSVAVDSSVQAISTSNPHNPLSKFAVAYGQADGQAKTSIQGATKISGKDVSITSTVETTNRVSARVFSNIGLSFIPLNLKDSGAAVAVSNTNTISKVVLDSDTNVSATAGNINISSIGKVNAEAKGTVNIFINGTAAPGIGVNFDNTEVLAEVNGKLTASGKMDVVDQAINLTKVDNSTNSFNIDNNGLQTGDQVIYSNGGGTSIGGLENNGNYFVLSQDVNNFKLTKGLGLDISNDGVNSTSRQSLSKLEIKEFSAANNLNLNANTISINNHGFTTGQVLTYFFTANDDAIGGLENNKQYFAIVQDANTIKLALTADDATRNNAIDLTAGGTSSGNRNFFNYASTSGSKTFNPLDDVNSKTNIITVTNHGFRTGDVVAYKVDRSISSTQNIVFNNSFDPTDTAVDLGSNTIKVPAHGFNTGDRVTYQTNYLTDAGTAITGLNANSDYYIIRVDENTVKLAATRENASIDQAIDLTRLGSGTLHSLKTTKPITVGDIELGGLEDGEFYYVAVIDANRIRLADSETDAFDAAAIDIDPTVASGISQAFVKPNASSGIIVSSSLNAKDKVNIAGKTGSNAKFKDLLAGADVLAFAGTIIRFGDTKKVLTEPLSTQQKDNPFSVGAAIGVNYFTHDVNAKVGGSAILKSGTDVKISATTKQEVQLIVDSSTGQGDKGGSISVSLGVSIYNNNVLASVGNNAQVDAKDKISVTSDLSYPFLFPFKDKFTGTTDKNAAASEISSFIFDAFFSGKLGLPNRLANTFVASRNKGKIDKGINKVTYGIAASFAYTEFNNKSQALIGTGAKINQDLNYRTINQSVAVNAQTKMTLLDITGIISLDFDVDTLISKGRGDTFSFYGNKAESGFGGSVMVSNINNTTIAKIDDRALVNTGTSGIGLVVSAVEGILAIGLAQAGGDSDKLGFTGSGTGVKRRSRTVAQIGNGVKVGGGKVTVNAKSSGDAISVAGAVQTGNGVGIGLSLSVNDIQQDTLAIIGGETDTGTGTDINATGDVNLSAKSSGMVATLSLAAALSGIEKDQPSFGNSYAGAGSISLNLVTNKTKAYFNNTGSVIVNNGNLNIDSNDGTLIVSIAGAIAVAPSNPLRSSKILSGTYSQNEVSSDTQSFIQGSSNITAKNITATSQQSGFIASLTAGNGSLSANKLKSNTRAYIDNTTGNIDEGVTLRAIDRSQIWAIAGAAGFGGRVGFGVSIANNFIGTDNESASTSAFIARSTLLLRKGIVRLEASHDAFFEGSPRIVSLAYSVESSDRSDNGNGLAIAGMSAVNKIRDDVSTYITNSRITDDRSDLGKVNVSLNSDDSSWIISLAGALALGQSGGFGAASSYSKINNKLRAYVEGSTLDIEGTLDLGANSNASIMGATIGVATATGNSGIAGAGSLSINEINNTVDAHISGSSNVFAGQAISLRAKDNSVLANFTGGFAGSTKRAVGAAISYNLVQNSILSYIDNSIVRTNSSLQTTATDSTLLVGLAVGGSGATNFALGGSITVNSIANTVDAHISGGADVSALGDIALTATESSTLYVVSGGIAGSSSGAAVGASVAYNYIGGSFDKANPNLIDRNTTNTNKVNAYIDSSKVIAGNNISIEGGYKAPTDALADRPSIVTADQINTGLSTVTLPLRITSQMTTVTVGGAGASGFALGGAVSLNFIRNTVDARISNIGANQSVIAGATLSVLSNDASQINSGAGGFGIPFSSGAVGAAVSSNEIKNTIRSRIGNVDGTGLTDSNAGKISGNQIQVNANSSATIYNVTFAGAGASSFAVGGSASRNLIENTIDAHISRNSNVVAIQNTNVTATDTSSNRSLSGQIATSVGGIGGGVALAFNDIKNNITAYVDASTLETGSLTVNANSTATLEAIAAGVNIGSTGGIAGSSGVNQIGDKIWGYVRNSNVTASGTINVLATDHSTIKFVAGAIAGGVSAVGAGGSVAIGNINNNTLAYMEGARTTSGGATQVKADAKQEIVTIAATAGAGGIVG